MINILRNTTNAHSYDINYFLLLVGSCSVQDSTRAERSCCHDSVGWLHEIKRPIRILSVAFKSRASKQQQKIWYNVYHHVPNTTIFSKYFAIKIVLLTVFSLLV